MVNKILMCLSHQLSHIGVCTLQINHLIDGAVNVGKGANVIISLVHHFLPLVAWVSMWHITRRQLFWPE